MKVFDNSGRSLKVSGQITLDESWKISNGDLGNDNERGWSWSVE